MGVQSSPPLPRVADTVAGDSGLGEAAGFQRNYIRYHHHFRQMSLLKEIFVKNKRNPVLTGNSASGVVSDAMEDWCSGLERRLWGMQYSILRQLDSHQVLHTSHHFTISPPPLHQAETRELVGQTGGLEELRLEVRDGVDCRLVMMLVQVIIT